MRNRTPRYKSVTLKPTCSFWVLRRAYPDKYESKINQGSNALDSHLIEDMAKYKQSPSNTLGLVQYCSEALMALPRCVREGARLPALDQEHHRWRRVLFLLLRVFLFNWCYNRPACFDNWRTSFHDWTRLWQLWQLRQLWKLQLWRLSEVNSNQFTAFFKHSMLMLIIGYILSNCSLLNCKYKSKPSSWLYRNSALGRAL